MTMVYIIRHAEAEGNLYRRSQGHYDGDITAFGRRQLDALAARFRDVKLDAIYSSDLTRALKTAKAIAEPRGMTVETTPRLREVCMGRWEDEPWGKLEAEEPEQLRYFNFDPDKWSVDGCESFTALAGRMTGIVSELAARHDGGDIALVTHGMATRTLLCAVLGIASEDVRSMPHGDNTSVSLLNVENGTAAVEYSNDNSHLGTELSTFAVQKWWKSKSGTDGRNLRFEPMNIRENRALYLDCYADSWRFSHGSLGGFEPEPYFNNAVIHSLNHPQALVKVIRGETFAGIVELDTARRGTDGCGWLTLCYLVPEQRGLGLGVQLLGHTISVYRKLGRSCIRLHVARDNAAAIGFYTRYGFRQAGESSGLVSRLLLLQKEL